MNWIVSPNNSYVEALTLNVTVVGDKVFMKVIDDKWGHNGETSIW